MSLAASGAKSSSPDGRLTRAIRAQLLTEEAGDFDREYRRVMTEATETLDLTPVLEMLRRWERVARLTAHDPQAHRRMLRAADALNAGEDAPMVSWERVKSELGP
jgi:dihydropteroate synthase